ncbi:MAG: sigma 54-interacting transcriptional regulator, partial [Deltaproteobacteria bacterium]|nr:sigma 54-interacting transcriptional regulator [Deltaproteobacteria bacterium]
GTLFLDEIAELSLGAQVQLLRVLQEGTLRRLGSESEQSVDVRVVSATHQDLEQAVAEGRFRADLFYRLVVFPLRVPPLRERGSDVVLLLKYFMNKHAAALEMPVPALTQEGEAQLQRYAWPGNVRELENLAQRLLLRGADPIDVADLSGHGQRLEAASSPSPSPSPSPPPPAGNSLFHAERSALLQALSDAGGNVTRAAAALGIGRATMYRKIARHGIVHRS